MKVIVFLAIYFAGGVALFPFLDLMRPVGVLLDHFYSQIFLGSDADVAQRLSLSFIYASLFHLVWSALFSEAAKRWASKVSVRDVCYLAFQCLSPFFHQPDKPRVGWSNQPTRSPYGLSSIFHFFGDLHASGSVGVVAQGFFGGSLSLHRKKNHRNH